MPLDDYRAWWAFVPGACWHRPEGPGSDTYTRARHPVVHVVHEDALAYARWAGRALPTEAEWERAARGGLDGATFAWGDEELPGGRHMANTWQGEFPWRDLGLDGHVGTSPVGAFPANGFGLADVCGNVWEWTADDFPVEHEHEPRRVLRARAGGPVPAHGHQGRLAPVRAELLPALPPGGPPGPGRRELDEPPRLPLRAARGIATAPCGVPGGADEAAPARSERVLRHAAGRGRADARPRPWCT